MTVTVTVTVNLIDRRPTIVNNEGSVHNLSLGGGQVIVFRRNLTRNTNTNQGTKLVPSPFCTMYKMNDPPFKLVTKFVATA